MLYSPLIIPPLNSPKDIVSTLLVTVYNSTGVLITTLTSTNIRHTSELTCSHSQITPDSIPPTPFVGLCIDMPRRGDVVYGGDVVVGLHYKEVDGGTEDFKGEEVCLTVIAVEDTTKDGATQDDSTKDDTTELSSPETVCVIATGSFLEFTPRATGVLMIAVQIITGQHTGSTAYATFTVTPPPPTCSPNLITTQTDLSHLPLLLVLSHYDEDLTWLDTLSTPAIVYR